ncbi:ubiquinone/menaquinone biosynthesis methyltransferase [Mucisphaera calidilacus]|uniref:Demethylmenaquinone methyltransferase n=1 Tax=Mucisphaera calidilacus TaxID=2527982 RepID=A0A518BWP6_9BACT|nr:ubiquinone/menaquinone biosynthesis methyltransferase [Mucisphaera calidilacus]QDU71402.1 UbiE/COQ5 methyltransferase [Mucisphaera calidilacus]
MSDKGWQSDQLGDVHRRSDKATRVRSMFAAIAPSYDLNNRLHSFGMDQLWRRALVRMSGVAAGERVLDVATGTGDVALAFARRDAEVLGVDFTPELLRIARGKRVEGHPRPLYVAGDAKRLPVADGSFDVVSIAFGIRNVDEPEVALGEFYRVLRPGGRLVILEFSQPGFAPVRWMNRLYCEVVMPRTAALIARDRVNAYRYLPASVSTFWDRGALMGAMGEAGFGAVRSRALTFGVARLYRGDKA